MRRHPNWQLAEEILSQVIPGAGGFDPDLIPGLTPDLWIDFKIDDRDPTAVTHDLLDYCEPIVSGALVIVTFHSFRLQVGPFFVSSKRMREFVRSYTEAYDDVPVAGDAFVVSAATALVVVIHHNGLIATVHGQAT